MKLMKPTLKNILAVIVGLFAGGAVNMAIITLFGNLIPPPEDATVTTMEGLNASIHLFEAKHFIGPFLAHATGTFIGALIVSILAASHKRSFAIGVSIFNFLGGLVMAISIEGPIWFEATDLIFAYIPMGLLAFSIVSKRK
jgi:hypothetical protein